jgi:AraC-like DNA-binding protein
MLLGVRDAPLTGARVEGAPAPPLTGAVLGYRGYREMASPPCERFETPAGEVILVLRLGDPFLAEQQPGMGEPTSFTSFIVGLHEGPIRTVYRGEQFGVQVRLDPPAAAALFGVAMHELANRVVDLADVVGGMAESWTAVLASAESWSRRFAALDVLLGEQIQARRGPSLIARRTWDVLRQGGGAVPIEALVTEVGCSHRHLVGLFRREVGLTPKRAARVLRYEQAARRLRDDRTAPAAVAAGCGYTDQPHLTREFRRFSGVTPAAVRDGGSGQFSTRP